MLDNKIIDFFVNGFGNQLRLLEIKKSKGANEIINDDYVQEYIEKMESQTNIVLTNDDKE